MSRPARSSGGVTTGESALASWNSNVYDIVDYSNALIEVSKRADSPFHGMEFERDEICTSKLAPMLGRFGFVFPATDSDGRACAIKTFQYVQADRAQRYSLISAHLNEVCSRSFVDLRYLDAALPIGGEDLPALRMAWSDGKPLNDAIDTALEAGDFDRQEWLQRWCTVLADLRSAHIIHGDIQHGNILVERDRTMVLVDFDGTHVPQMGTRFELQERGHEDYQHPNAATALATNRPRDDVPGLVILATLAGIDAALWDQRLGADGLLLSEVDLAQPSRSTMLTSLASGPDPAADIVALLVDALADESAAPTKLNRAAALCGIELAGMSVSTRSSRPKRKRPSDAIIERSSWEIDLAAAAASASAALSGAQPEVVEKVATDRGSTDDALVPSQPNTFAPDPAAAPPPHAVPSDSAVDAAAGWNPSPLEPREVLLLAGLRAGLDPQDLRRLGLGSKSKIAQRAHELATGPQLERFGEVFGFELTRRQAETVQLALVGAPLDEIADELGLAASTARHHLRAGLKAMRQSDRVDVASLLSEIERSPARTRSKTRTSAPIQPGRKELGGKPANPDADSIGSHPAADPADTGAVADANVVADADPGTPTPPSRVVGDPTPTSPGLSSVDLWVIGLILLALIALLSRI